MKFAVTPELATLLKTIRTQNSVSSKDLAEEVERSPSYISKLESGVIKTVPKELLTKILLYISDGEDFFEDCLPGAVRVLDTFMEPERWIHQLWLLQYDLMDRPVTVSAEMSKDMNRRLEELKISPSLYTELVNENYDSAMPSSDPANVVLLKPSNEGERLLVKVKVDQSDVRSILSGTATKTNYITANCLVYMLMRLNEYGVVRSRLSAKQASRVLEMTSAYLGQYDLHTLTGFSHQLASREFIERQRAAAWPLAVSDNRTLQGVLERYEDAMNHDAVNTQIVLSGFLDTWNWDPGFTMKLLSIPFKELEGLSFRNKQQLLDEIRELIDRYASLSDYEKKMETYD